MASGPQASHSDERCSLIVATSRQNLESRKETGARQHKRYARRHGDRLDRAAVEQRRTEEIPHRHHGPTGEHQRRARRRRLDQQVDARRRREDVDERHRDQQEEGRGERRHSRQRQRVEELRADLQRIFEPEVDPGGIVEKHEHRNQSDRDRSRERRACGGAPPRPACRNEPLRVGTVVLPNCPSVPV